MTDSQALRAALREGRDKLRADIQKSRDAGSSVVMVDNQEAADLLSDLDRVERERDGLLLRFANRTDEFERLDDRCAVLEKALKDADDALAQITAFEDDARYIMGNTNFELVKQRREAVKAALSSSPVVGGGETNTSSQGCGTDHSGDLLNAGGERVDAAAPFDMAEANYEGAMADLDSLLTAVIRRLNGEADLAGLAEFVTLNYPKRAAEIRPEPTVEAAAALANEALTYRGWSLEQNFIGQWDAYGPNYDASYEGPEEGWVDNGQKVQGYATADEARAAVDDFLSESGQ